MLPDILGGIIGSGHPRHDHVPLITNVRFGAFSTEELRAGTGQTVRPEIDPTGPDTVPEHLSKPGGEARITASAKAYEAK